MNDSEPLWDSTAMGHSHDHDHRDGQLQPLDYVELSLIVISSVLHIIYILTLVRTQIMHVNLKTIYFFICFTLCVFLTSRLLDIIMILVHFHEDHVLHILVHILHESSYSAIVSTFLLVSIERLFATIHSETYEQQKHLFKVVIAFIALFLWSVAISFLIHIASIGFVILAIYVTICDIVTVCVTVGLLIYNMKAFKLTTTSHMKLSQRYQIRENIKFIFMALPVNIVQIIAVTVALVAIWKMLISYGNKEFEKDRISQRIYNFAITLFALFMPIVMRITHMVQKRILFRDTNTNILVAGGRDSAHKALDRTDGHFYFTMLKSAWK